jgi:hypothetical protein
VSHDVLELSCPVPIVRLFEQSKQLRVLNYFRVISSTLDNAELTSAPTGNGLPHLLFLHSRQPPLLLTGHIFKTPHPSPNDIGTHDYSEPTRTAIFGQDFDVTRLRELNELYHRMNSTPAAWTVGNLGAEGSVQSSPDYMKPTADNSKRVFTRYVNKNGKDGEIVCY